MKAETTTMLLPVTVFEAGADKDIEFESTLADYLPNINRIIRADADVTCEDIQITGSKAEVSGKAVFTLLYESDFKQKLRHERFSADFVQRFDLRDLPEGELFPTAKAKCSYVGCKTLNPRRFILRCRADIGLEIRCMQSVQIVSMEDCKGAFFRSDRLSTAVFTPDIMRDFGVEESVSLDSLPPINEIVYTALDFSSVEISPAEGSALVRGEACFKCLYEPEGEDAPLQMLCRRFPAVFTVDDESISPESELNVSLSPRKVEAAKDIDAYGENRIIQLNYGARLCMSCVNRRELTIPTDMFFEDYISENKPASFTYEEPVKALHHRFSIDKMFEAGELALDSCLDVNADISVTETVMTDEGISVKGNCGINVFGADGSSYRAQDLSIPFSELIPFSTVGKEYALKAAAVPQNAVAEIIGGRLSVRIPALLSVSIKYKESLSALSSAEVEKREDGDQGNKPIVIYYPEKGESAWSIGKRYYINPEKVKENNESAFDKNGSIAEKGTVIYM